MEVELVTEHLSLAAFRLQVQSDSNLIPSVIRCFGLTVHTVVSECPDGLWFRLGHSVDPGDSLLQHCAEH